MRAMVLTRQGAPPIERQLAPPRPGPGQVAIRVAALARLREGRLTGAAVLVP